MFNILAQKVAETSADKLAFTTENIAEAGLCSVAGMVGIFLVVGVIILSVSILNKIGAEKK